MNSRNFSRFPRKHWVAAIVCVLGLGLGGVGCQDSQEQLDGFLEQGNAYLEDEQYQEAIIEFRNVLQIDPNHVEGHRNLSKAYFKAEKVREGYWELSETIRLDPQDIDSRIQYTAIGMAGGRFDEVIESADEIIAMDPQNATAHLFRGQALLGLDRIDEAQEAMELAVSIAPEESGGHLSLTALYQQLGETEKAEAQARESLKQEPTTLGHTMLAALLNQREADDEEILSHLKSAVELSLVPDEDGKQGRDLTAAYRNLASFYFDRDRGDEGVVVLEEGIAKLDENKVVLNDALVAYYRIANNREKIDETLLRATTFDPSDAGPWLVISNTRALLDDHEGAMEATEQALAVAPDDSL
ncbi:tetratricopeptide repeat protein, partial [Myxococcota bacterium]|nr:tetratricopeptide repeat protein [Myxococcota bacterium]